MKKLTFFASMLFASFVGFSQNTPINFEPGGFGANWTWTVFENDTNPPIEIIANPDASGINTSATVAKMTALQAGDPWAGCESMRGATDLGHFVLGPNNSIIKVMVWKSVISDVGIKLASDSGWAQPEIKVSNTLINQWEELTFNFSSYINPPAHLGQLSQIIFFPDFNLSGRTQTNIVYFDNITFSAGTVSPTPMNAAPTPNRLAANVISIFSDAYNNLPGVDFNPNWGQSTVVAQIPIQGNNTIRYSNLNYQGIDLGSNIDVTSMDFLHVDIWTQSTTPLQIFLISPGPVETPFALTVPTSGWSGFDIPLAAFAPVALNNVFQFKFVGGGEVFIDNLYFYKISTSINELSTSNKSLLVYPNPAKIGDLIRLNAEVQQIELFDLSGRMVATSKNSIINTAGLQEGMYVIRTLTLDGKLATQKLILN